MTESIKLLCILSLIFGAVLSLMNSGNIKSITEVLCTAILTAVVLNPIKEFDMDAFSLQSAKMRELEAKISSGAQESEDRLNRLVIQSECEEYIEDKAKSISDEELSAVVTAQWSLDGLWVPYSVKLTGAWLERDRQRLGEIIEADLGIPTERQEWSNEG